MRNGIRRMKPPAHSKTSKLQTLNITAPVSYTKIEEEKIELQVEHQQSQMPIIKSNILKPNKNISRIIKRINSKPFKSKAFGTSKIRVTNPNRKLIPHTNMDVLDNMDSLQAALKINRDYSNDRILEQRESTYESMSSSKAMPVPISGTTPISESPFLIKLDSGIGEKDPRAGRQVTSKAQDKSLINVETSMKARAHKRQDEPHQIQEQSSPGYSQEYIGESFERDEPQKHPEDIKVDVAVASDYNRKSKEQQSDAYKSRGDISGDSKSIASYAASQKLSEQLETPYENVVQNLASNTSLSHHQKNISFGISNDQADFQIEDKESSEKYTPAEISEHNEPEIQPEYTFEVEEEGKCINLNI